MGIALCALLVTARVGCATTEVVLFTRESAISVEKVWQHIGGRLETLATAEPSSTRQQPGTEMNLMLLPST